MASSRHYYIDPSCGEHFELVFLRAELFAASALGRLNNPADTHFARVFERIFKTPATDTEPMARSRGFEPARAAPVPGPAGALTCQYYYDDYYHDDKGDPLRPRPVLAHVRRELCSLAYGWEGAPARAGAEVRIHWDGPGRYEQRRPGVLLDPANDLVRLHGSEVLGDLFAECAATVTWDHPPAGLRPAPAEDQHPQRVVIDFAERARDRRVSWETVERHNLIGLYIDRVAVDLLEATLIHEMMHCRAYGLVDFFDENGATSGWRLVMGLSKEESYICAESIAMLCVAAGLADLRPVGLPSGYRYTISDEGIIIGYEEMLLDWGLV